ncbi:hypothetical protein DPM13_14070 [Paracoccus mutanolyticus]|uniref:Uncharacterized protein n=1 Tax=Paracoccus mutanolyticus TaxID=1499308 RepID=A0ABM6WT12_9RHOB|nr:hypothetical protein DPM13_14070 [Paracoccus mutanolyticus]
MARSAGEEQWGGLCLTLFLFVATSVLGMPMAIGLALMRRSELPVVAKVTGLFIVGSILGGVVCSVSLLPL